MRTLGIITHGFPSGLDPTAYSFVKELASAVARQGTRVLVIAPMPVHRVNRRLAPRYSVEAVGQNEVLEVYRPAYVSAKAVPILSFNTRQLGFATFCSAVRRVLKDRGTNRPDALYGHFLYLGGAAAVRLGEKMGIPAFPMVGDGMLCSMTPFGVERARRHLKGARAFMTNSSSLASLLQERLGVSPDGIGVFPNGVDHGLFFPRDKEAMRARLGLPEDRFLVICVAKQDLQKGPARVGEAIRGLRGVSGIFLGNGPNPPKADNIVFNQPVPHHQVPKWLSAADLLVLPSTYEGCCNAILEAMACGLPVVSSIGDFNDDILNPEVSIRVDPMDVEAIRRSIEHLRDHPGDRRRMAEAASRWSSRFDVDARARDILAFITRQVAKNRPRT